jgi:preprotein translocase subunit SecD
MRHGSTLRVAVLVGLLMAACVMEGCTKPYVGAVVTYQVDASGVPRSDVAQLQQAAGKVLSSRIGDAGLVELLDEGRIALHLYGEIDDFELDAARRLATTPGELQFRIMASRKIDEHAAIIDAAMTAPVTEVVRLPDGPTARWFECALPEIKKGSYAPQSELVVREVDGRTFVLGFVDDRADVTSDYFLAASSELDETGRPQIAFEFNPEGAALFGKLTGDHLPRADGGRYMLGIILDDVLLSAPTIESKITTRGRISGNPVETDLDAILPLLRSGSLPRPLREVSVTRAEE